MLHLRSGLLRLNYLVALMMMIISAVYFPHRSSVSQLSVSVSHEILGNPEWNVIGQMGKGGPTGICPLMVTGPPIIYLRSPGTFLM